MEIRHSTLWMAVSAMLPLMAHAATPLDIDARWKQEAVITHPDHARYPNTAAAIQQQRKNIFDWRTQHLQVGMSSISGEDELMTSPFYICEIESLYNIPGGAAITSDIMGPGNQLPPATSCTRRVARTIADKIPDMDPNSGWELLKFNLGYKMQHYANAKSAWSADGDDAFSTNQYPYLILYNRMTAKLRVMGYFPGYTIGTGVAVTLSTTGKSKLFDSNQSADARFYSSSKTGFGAINNAQDGGWGVTDFQVNLDPCSAGSDEIDLNIKISPKAIANVELYGHATGISQNITDEGIGDPAAYLMDVSGSLSDNLEQAGNYTVSNLSDLQNVFGGINDSATSNAVASDALGAAGDFLGGMMELAPGGSSVTAGFKALAGTLSGVGSIFGTQAAAVPGYSPIIPQISFSEVYLRGETTSSDPGITVKLKMPGSLSTAWQDFGENGASDISFPLYDEPMGLFTLLTTPKVRVDKTYSDRSGSQGYKLVTTFIPSNVVLASNAKSGLTMSGWNTTENTGVNLTGRLKIKYLVSADVTPQFTNLHDIDGNNDSFSYAAMSTNGSSSKLYTVVTDDVPLMYLYDRLNSKRPSISFKGGKGVVDSISLIVTAKNNSATLHDNILNKDIAMVNKTDAEGKFVPYYLTMKEYPATLSYTKDTLDPDSDAKRLVNSGQLGNVTLTPKQGLDIRLGAPSSQVTIKNYCAAEGEYNKPHEVRSDGTYAIYADEDMAYYTYDPKQVSQSQNNYLTLGADGAYNPAMTWGFLSFNLGEYVAKYGNRKPSSVSLRIEQYDPGTVYISSYWSYYFFSANASTWAMRQNSWKEYRPKFSDQITYSSEQVAWVDVTDLFNAALDRAKTGSGDTYEQPRLSFTLDPGYASFYDKYVYTSEATPAKAPQLTIHF